MRHHFRRFSGQIRNCLLDFKEYGFFGAGVCKVLDAIILERHAKEGGERRITGFGRACSSSIDG